MDVIFKCKISLPGTDSETEIDGHISWVSFWEISVERISCPANEP